MNDTTVLFPPVKLKGKLREPLRHLHSSTIQSRCLRQQDARGDVRSSDETSFRVPLRCYCIKTFPFHSNPASMAPGSLYVPGAPAAAAGGNCGCCGAGGGAA